MSNLIEDIKNDYNDKMKRGVKEVYYKKDLLAGIKLIFTLIGLMKIALLIGGAAAASIGSLFSFVSNNPQTALQLGKTIQNNAESIKELVLKSGERLNNGYNKLPENEKKMVRTVILIVAKCGLSWDDLI